MIFIDTTFLIALLFKTDPLHEKALLVSESINERKIINNTVLCETLNSFSGNTLLFSISLSSKSFLSFNKPIPPILPLPKPN